MAQRFCEVALPVPLRSTFTYAVPASFNGEELIGRRVVVPFRNRAMVGVGLALSDRAPEIAGGKKSIREIVELMDTVPALPPKLIELGQWISRYYIAPIGETMRAMLPPEIEVRHDREYSLSDAGRAYVAQLTSGVETTEEESTERALLERLNDEGGAASSAQIRRWPGGEASRRTPRSPRLPQRSRSAPETPHSHAENSGLESGANRFARANWIRLRKKIRLKMTRRKESKKSSPPCAGRCRSRFSPRRQAFRAR